MESYKIPCARCGYDEIQSDIHLHHLVPITIGGTDSHGRKYLCKRCHNILHNMLLTQVWKSIPDKDKEAARESIKNYSLWWISKK
jgi:5-methylcytosine-specific restriction endonuclease McrA